jgi:hypothetical protein
MGILVSHPIAVGTEAIGVLAVSTDKSSSSEPENRAFPVSEACRCRRSQSIPLGLEWEGGKLLLGF